MKICTGCTRNKEDEDFAFRNKAKGTRQSFCRFCRKEVDSSLYKSNPEFRAKKINRSKEYRNRNQQYLLDYLIQHPCVDCGEPDPIVLDFDHQFDKNDNVTSMVDSSSIKNLQLEIDKCEIRCANCHRRKTAKQFGSFRLEVSLRG